MKRTIALTPQEAGDVHLVATAKGLIKNGKGDSLVFRSMSLRDVRKEARRLRAAVEASGKFRASEEAGLARAA